MAGFHMVMDLWVRAMIAQLI